MAALRFEWGWALWALIPIFAAWPSLLWFDIRRARRRLEALGSPESRTLRRRAVKLSLALTSLSLMILALARPQAGVRAGEMRGPGMELVLALDVSASMGVEDVYPNRLARAKEEAAKLIGRARGGLIGVVAFAGRAAVLCPLTEDIEAAREAVKSIELGCIPSPGTRVSEALREAMSCFGKGRRPKAILLLTDGESHGDEVEAVRLAREAKGKGIKIFAIGIGTAQGGIVPGKGVISALRDDLLAEVTAETGGSWGTELEGVWPKLALEMRRGMRISSLEYREIYRWPALMAALLLIAELLL